VCRCSRGNINQPIIRKWQRFGLALLCLFPWWALAQVEAAIWPDTGDAWVDQQLLDINKYAQHYPDAFIDELVRYGSAQPEMVAALLDRNWLPGDIWLACFWAQIVSINCNQLLQLRQQYRQWAWREILQQLPVKPENLHYRALRHALVASFDHWERPIMLDARLQQQLGTRAQRDERARQRHQTAE